ncbi:hypothetical protein TNCV_483971 [Trichonephila clavipes]|nr:hypothetical protein TNCV_483971 [Trichonephila clavipes]
MRCAAPLYVMCEPRTEWGSLCFGSSRAHVLLFSFQRGPSSKCEPYLRCQDPRDRRKNVRSTTEGLFAYIYRSFTPLVDPR